MIQESDTANELASSGAIRREACQLGAGLQRLVASLLLVLSLVAGTAEADRKLHVIVAADTDDPSIGKYCQTDMEIFQGLFHLHVVPRDLSMVTIPARNITREGVQRAIERQSIKPDDAVCFYYSGHGAYTNNGQHYIATKAAGERWISRESILAALGNNEPGLVVLLTDSCANFVDVTVGEEVGGADNEETSPLFRRLFFETNGLVDVNSCERGQQAGTRLAFQEGSIFTKCVCEVMDQYSGVSARDWNWILDRIATQTAADFKVMYPDGVSVQAESGDYVTQRTQTVARNTVQIVDLRPGRSTQPELVHAWTVTINPKNGVALLEDRVRWEPPSNRAIPPDHQFPPQQDQAQLVTASDGTRYWTYQRHWAPAAPGAAPPPAGGNTAAGNSGGGNAGGDKPRLLKGSEVPANRVRFGVGVETDSRPGVVVNTVVPDSPATKLHDANGNIWKIEEGDRILQINGRNINTRNDFLDAVSGSGQIMLLTIQSADGTMFQVGTILNN